MLKIHLFVSGFSTVPTLSLSSETYIAVEDEGSVEVCVVLNIPLSFALDFRVITTDTGSATAGKKEVNIKIHKMMSFL